MCADVPWHRRWAAPPRPSLFVTSRLHHKPYDEAGLVNAFRAEALPPKRDTATVIVIDRSHSMQGWKLQAAKELARVGFETMPPTDTIAVVAFNTEAQEIVAPTKSANRVKVAAEVSKLEPGGNTNIHIGLLQAQATLIDSGAKHIVRITDGEALDDDETLDLARELRAAKIVVSEVAQKDADLALLTAIAEIGDGRLFRIDDSCHALPGRCSAVRPRGATRRALPGRERR